ncbi:hypothetical protein PT974_07105 [Cladobotryum mycophilum]|uniref:U4/U6.U5 small nuclear ribonucleoprotein 27kDa protein domain-containing protein n=1 Tax=Cladobotryum mycophilum TaxID=491253 RepID=A0ABR0SNC6_9HYPO
MSDPRRNRRPDSRQMWDESDRRDRGPPRDRDRDRERDRDRNRDRGDETVEATDQDRETGVGAQAIARGHRITATEIATGIEIEADGRDRRRDEDANDRDRNQKPRDGYNRRSASPDHHSPPQPSSLPTRPRQDPKKQQHQDTSFNKPNSRRSPSPPRKDKEGRDATPMDEDGVEPDGEGEGDDDFAAMQAMMGFGGFGTTKGKKVAGNTAGGISKEKKTEYRQYMNRQGGFNRPLSPGR